MPGAFAKGRDLGRGAFGPGLGMIEPGNIDANFFARPQVPAPEGGTATVRSFSFEGPKGETLLPTVTPDGRIVSQQDAIHDYLKTGQHLGVFSTPDAATDYAKMLHQGHEYLMGLKK